MTMGSVTPLLVESLSKAYHRRPVLTDVSFRVDAGEALAIIGPNGAGKSTLLGCLSGDRVPDRGTVRVLGYDPFEEPEQVAAGLGFVPEITFLYDELTVGETIRFMIEVRRLASAEGWAEAERLLELFGLTAAQDVICRELSQGMGRKVAIILALIHRPGLLVLDEVFNGLDQSSARALIDELDQRRLAGAAVLLSSHDHALLARWCDRGLLIGRDGWRELTGDAWGAWRDQQLRPRVLDPPGLDRSARF